MPETPVVDAFVSYSRRDAARALEIVKAGERLGRSFWIDTAELQAGTAWPHELRRALESADAVVCLLSAAWLASAECRREYDLGHELGKRIVPVLLEELSYEELPPTMRSVQWFDARHLDADDVAARVIVAIDLDIERVREHTLWLGRALRWDATGRDRSQLARGRELRDAEAFLARGGVDPAPVALQVEYVTAGRASERTRQRLLLGSVSTALVGALVLSLIALHLRGVADDQRTRAEAERDAAVAKSLVDQSRSLSITDPTAARLSALAAWRIEPDPDTRQALVQAATDRAVRLFDTASPPAFAAAVSPDGSTLATGGADNLVRLWDVRTGAAVGRPLSGHRDNIRYLAWSSDGRLASASDDGEVRIWDPNAGAMALGPLSGGPVSDENRGNFVWQVVWAPDGSRLATVSTDGQLREFDARTGRPTGPPLLGLRSALTAVAYTADGRTLIAAGDDHKIRFIDLATRGQVRPAISIDAVANPVLTLSPDGTALAVGQGDGKVAFYRVADHSKLTELAASTQAIYAMAFSDDGAVLATAGDESPVRLWDLHDPHPWGQPLATPGGQVRALSFVPGRHELMAAGSDGVVRLWDLDVDGAKGAPLRLGTTAARAVATTPDGDLVVVGYAGDALALWDPAGSHDVGTLSLGTTAPVDSVDVSPDGHYVAAGTNDGQLFLWNLESRTLLAHTSLPRDGAIHTVQFTPDGTRVVTGDGDNLDTVLAHSAEYGVRQWNVPDLSTHGAVITVPATIKDMALTPDGRAAVTSVADQVEVLDLVSARVRARRTVGLGLAPIAVSPDGRWIAVATSRGIVLLGRSGLEPGGQALTAPFGTTSALAFSPDSHTLAGGSVGNTIQLWDVDTRTSVGEPLVGHVSGVEDLEFAPDGTWLASAGDTTARLWDTSFLPDPAEALCTQTGRSLTRTEWRDLVGEGVEFREVC